MLPFPSQYSKRIYKTGGRILCSAVWAGTDQVSHLSPRTPKQWCSCSGHSLILAVITILKAVKTKSDSGRLFMITTANIMLFITERHWIWKVQRCQWKCTVTFLCTRGQTGWNLLTSSSWHYNNPQIFSYPLYADRALADSVNPGPGWLTLLWFLTTSIIIHPEAARHLNLLHLILTCKCGFAALWGSWMSACGWILYRYISWYRAVLWVTGVYVVVVTLFSEHVRLSFGLRC